MQGWILLAGTFYLSPFLGKFLAVSECLLFEAVWIYPWFVHPRKNVTFLYFPFFYYLFSSFSLPFFSWPHGLSSRLLQLCPGTFLLEVPETCIFPLQRDSGCPTSPQYTFCLHAGTALDLACSWVNVVCLLERRLFPKKALLLPATVQNQ